MEVANVLVTCEGCQTDYRLKVPKEGFWKWQKGMSIDKAMPEMPRGVRNILQNRLCPGCMSKKNPGKRKYPGAVKSKHDKKLWHEAEKSFEHEMHLRAGRGQKKIKNKWAYIMATYQSMKGLR